MSIKNIKGDLLSSNCVIRCQIVNCCGVADGGLAAQVEEKYPEAAAIYKGLCNTFGAGLLGEVQLVPCHDGSVIANMFAQSEWSGNKSVTNIQALEKCFERILILAAKTGLSFGFPKNLGAGYGKGDWEEISSLIEGYFSHPSDKCFVVEYEEPPKPAEVPESEGRSAPAKESKSTEEAKPAEEPKPAERPQEPSKPAGEPKKIHVQICAMGINENGAGGWGVVLRAGKTDKVLSGGAAKSPAEDMVLTAMISGLAALKWPCKVDLFINSFAIMNAVSSNGGKPIGATALWNQLAEAQAKHTVSVHLTDGYDTAIVERCKAAAKEKAQELVSKAS